MFLFMFLNFILYIHHNTKHNIKLCYLSNIDIKIKINIKKNYIKKISKKKLYIKNYIKNIQ